MRNIFIWMFFSCSVFINADSKQEIQSLQRVFRSASEKIAPYIVQIKVERIKDIPLPPPSFFLQDFESLPFVQRNNWKSFLKEIIEVSKRPLSPVSGVMISSNGEIVTSYYNIAGTTTKLEVFLSSGENYPAKIIAVSQLDDIALLKINKKTYIPPFRSQKLSVGSFAIVVGKSKSAQYYTVNTGIVSALKRYHGFSSQLDARVNYGNAGGAVVDIHGELCGIVNRVSHYAKSGQTSGVGFFTSTSRLRHILSFLRKKKNILIPLKPFLGIRISRMRKYSDFYSVYIDSVFPETPAHRAGVLSKDVILAVNDQKIKERGDFLKIVNKVGIGNKVKLKILRNSKIIYLDVLLEARPIFF